SPASSMPALLEMIVSSFTPLSRIASISADGMPHRPNPPDMIVMPSLSTPARAAFASGNILLTAMRAPKRKPGAKCRGVAPSARTVGQIEGCRLALLRCARLSDMNLRHHGPPIDRLGLPPGTAVVQADPPPLLGAVVPVLLVLEEHLRATPLDDVGNALVV